jgi:RNA polymerase sigma factor (sigma-70 family)
MATHQLNRLAGLLTSAYSAAQIADESDGDLLDRCRTGADPAAFEAIVRRHGNRVLGACRKVLSDPADIDDVFQATFLTLLRNPRAVRKAASLGAWLYGVAHRIAVRARDTAHRRRGLLKKAARPVDADGPDLSWKEACTVLHSELDRLPDTLRLPLVLCYLDGLSRDEAAAQLGWSLNEVRGRLERGRDRLRKRLEKRGIALSAGLLAVVAGNSVTAGGPPTRFIEIALRVLAGRPSVAAAALASGVSPVMANTLKTVSAVVLAAGVLLGVGMQRPDAIAGPKPGDAKSTSTPVAGPATPAAPPEFGGQVLDPDGKPVKGAKVYFLYYTPNARPIPERAVTDADGRFHITMKLGELDPTYQSEPWNSGSVFATAAGFGCGWVAVGKQPDQLAIRLSKDDKPLAGRAVNLEGKPLVGVTVRVTELMGPREGKDLSKLVADLKTQKSGYGVLNEQTIGFQGSWIGRDLGTLFPATTTDSDGRFRIPGVGADRIATIRFESPGVEGRVLRVLTREAEAVTVPEWNGTRGTAPDQPMMTFVGNDFTYALAPGRTVTGVVTDKATGKPLADAVLVSERVAGNPISGRHEFRALADKDGRFAMHGLPLGQGNVLRAGPAAGQPFLMQYRDVPVPAGTNPAPLDFALTRGVELTVKVTDAATKTPVPGWIEYFTYPDNPTYVAIKRFAAPDRQDIGSEAGGFRMVVPAGPGLIAFRARAESYPVAIGADQFKDRMRQAFINTVPGLCHPASFTVLAPVDPKLGDQTASVDIVLDAGKSVTGKVLDPDGKPLTGALARGLKSAPLVFGVWDNQPLQTAEFKAVAVDAKRPRSLVFLHPEKKLGGTVRMTGEEKGPIEVKLRPWATVTGRLVDAEGRPQANIRLGFVMSLDDTDPAGVGDLPDREMKTDAAGRFSIGGFVPGLRYNLTAIDSSRVLADVTRGTQFKEGEVKDVGDVVLKPPGE